MKCVYVINVDPWSWVNVRQGPGTQFAVVGSFPAGAVVEVICWAPGEWINGYNIWTKHDTPGGAPRFIFDYYLSTGYVQAHLPRCWGY